MADSLADLQNTAQGNTLGDINNTTGATPTTIGTAQSLGASQNAAQMVSTPQQQKAALKEALSPKNTLAELQRTMTGRAQAKTGQSTAALESLEAAKAASGLAGKIGAATTAAVSNANLALDVVANLDSIPGKSPDEKTAMAADLAKLTESFKDPAKDSMAAYKDLKTKYNLTDEQIAKLYNVDPSVLWGKVESQLPKGTLVKDLYGVADQAQLDTVRNMLPADEQTKFDNMTWEEAKQVVNKKLNDSMTNVTDLQRQATDRTLPASTRTLAVQRLRELGMTGEMQATEEIKTAQQVIEDADNVYIDGQAYEASEVLNSPESKALISDILTGAKDISALKGTPFEGLESMLRERGDKLAEYFGLDKGQLTGFGKIQELEKTRAANETAINDFFRTSGLTPTTDTNVLKALGITDDMQKGYAAFNPAVVQQNKVLNTVLSMPAETRAGALSVLATPGADAVINGEGGDAFLGMMKTAAGQSNLKNIIKTTSISRNMSTVNDDKDDTFTILSELGVPMGAIEGIKSLAGMDIKNLGGNLPTLLDSNNDGRVDDFKQVEQRLSKASMTDLNNLRTAIDPNAIQKAVKQKSTDDGIVSAYKKPLSVSGGLKDVLPSIKKISGMFPTDGQGGYKVVNGMVQLSPSITSFANMTPQSVAANPGNVRMNAISFENNVADSIKELEKVLSTNIKDASQQARDALTTHYAPLLASLKEARRLNNIRLSAAETALGNAAAAAAAAEKTKRETSGNRATMKAREW